MLRVLSFSHLLTSSLPLPNQQHQIRPKSVTMVDVDRRIPPSLSPSHAAGLRRLSTRASTAASSPSTAGLHSFAPFASSLLSLLDVAGVPLSPGLSELDLFRIESLLNFSFPPDLRALLSHALPSSPGFPDWRCASSLPSLLRLPSISLSLQVSTSCFWPASLWGPRPVDTNAAVDVARSALRRAPVLVPLFGRYYIPSRPCLAGNPVFYIDEDRIFSCANNLGDFFSRFAAHSSPPPVTDRGAPRYIEFWTDAAESFRRRSRMPSERHSSCSSLSEEGWPGPDPERFVELRPAEKRAGGWVRRYMDGMGTVLREGGWGEEEVEEMVHVSAACSIVEDEEAVVVEALAVRAGRWAEEMRRAGWSSDEVAEMMGLEVVGKERRRREVKLPPDIRMKVDRLAQEVLRI